MSEKLLDIKIFSDILCNVLNAENIVITNDTTAAEVDGWDSLNHVRVVLELEKVTKKKVPLRLINRTANVGELLDLYNSFA